MHQLGMVTLAVFEYKKVLEIAPAVPEGEDKRIFDLKGEAAFNLSLIYRQVGFRKNFSIIMKKKVTNNFNL